MNPEFLSGEASASPAVETLLGAAKRFSAAGFGNGLLAARNGPRVTMHAQVPLELLTPQDFVEVADYDPHLDRLMLIGSRPPHPNAGVVQLVFRAKSEVGAVVMIDAPDHAAKVPVAERGRTTLDNALAILGALRGSDVASWGAHLIVTGRTPAEAIARAEALLA